MLHRFLFVAGMTMGVMTPLIWAAYVSRPVAHVPPVAHGPTVKIASAAPAARMWADAAAEDTTGSILPASTPPAVPTPILAQPKMVQVPLPPPRPSARPSTIARTKPILAQASPVLARASPPHPAAHRNEERYRPAVVDNYNGAHIITVCAALTVSEQLRAGCP